MKRWKKALISVLTVCLMAGMVSTGAQASAPAEENGGKYQYAITLYAGDKGQIDGQDKITIYKNYGEEVNLFQDYFDKIELNAEDDKYYVKGFRLSGRDNDDMNNLEIPAFTAKKDVDYVVAYGIKGDQVSYVVQYQDADGNELLPSQTFYGNIGDKPIVAYRYIDGWIPQTLALTKTLSATESENVFTFIYVPGDPSDIVNNVTETTTVDGTQVVTVTVPGQAAGGAGGGGGAAGADDAAEGGETETIEEDQTPQGTQDIIDLDEEETPQGTMDIEDVEEEETAKGLPLAFSVGIGAVAAVVLICLVVWLLKGRKSGDSGTTEE